MSAVTAVSRARQEPVTGGGHEEERVVHLDHGLADSARSEVPSRALGETVEAGGHGGEMLGVLPREAGGGADREAVVGQHDGVPYLADAHHQVVEQPVQFAGPPAGPRVRVLDHSGSPSLLGLPDSGR